MNKFVENFIVGYLIGIVISIIMIILSKTLFKEEEVNPPTPVEKNVIDTLYLTRDKIITKVEYLDSIKYDTIEKIYVLNDTTSIELFYKLVSE